MQDAAATLSSLVESGRLEEAAQLCLQHLHDDGSQNYWLRQLGFVSFLDEGNQIAYYERAPQAFRDLAQRMPEDADAQFWLGYVRSIVENDSAGAELALWAATRLDPHHAYAHLAMAGLKAGRDAVSELKQTVSVQPGNLRAWRALAQQFEQLGERGAANQAWGELLRAAPQIETRYGIMNTYVNDVLTGASHAEKWRELARAKLT